MPRRPPPPPSTHAAPTMTSRLRNHRTRKASTSEAQGKNGDFAPDLISDTTISLSTPASDQDDVSFSSSEGSSYYSDADVTSLKQGDNNAELPEKVPIDSSKGVDEQVFDSSAKLAKALQDLSDSLRSDRTSTKSPNQGPEHNQSNATVLPRPFSRTNPVATDRRTSKEVTFQIPDKRPPAPFHAAIPLMEMVDCYSAIDSSSHNSIVSSTCFLTKENTNEVFCKRMIPLEIAADNSAKDDDISAVSATVAGSTVGSPQRGGGGSSERAVHMHPERPETEQENDANERVNLALIFVHGIAVSSQETLSSLESLSSWEDNFEEGDIAEATGSEDAVKSPTRKTRKRGNLVIDESQKEFTKTDPMLPKSTEFLTVSHQDESDSKDMQDLSMDERIRQLKKEIRKMQKSSNLAQSSSVSNQTSTLSTSLADEQTSRQSSGRHLPLNSLEHEHVRNTMNRAPSHVALPRFKLESTANSKSTEPPQVPKEIPLTDMDEISVIDCEIKPMENGIHRIKNPSSYDIERALESDPESKFDQKEGASRLRQEKRKDGPFISLQRNIQDFVDVGHQWTHEAAVAVSHFASGMVERYRARSLKDQILLGTIAVGIFILFILIIVVVAN